MRWHRLFVGCVALSLAAGGAARADNAAAFKNSVKGTPKTTGLDVLSFGPNGLLLIGDGRSSQVLAVDTGDVDPAGKPVEMVAGVQKKLAERLGVDPAGVEILDVAVNPASGKTYIAVRRQDDKSHVLLTVDGAGKIAQFSLENVTYARIALPLPEKAQPDRVTDVAWSGGRVLAAARANEEFASKIFVAPIPLEHDAPANVFSAETYHVAHGKWETRAPMSVLIPYNENGQNWVVGAFACTPVVKYSVDAIEPGGKVKGVSVLELGSGNRPIDMFTYAKGGQSYVLSNTFRMHHARAPIGPSPYWTVRFKRDVLDAKDDVNEKALRRVTSGATPAQGTGVEVVEGFAGVMQMDQWGDTHAVVLKQNGDSIDLQSLPLP